MLDWNHCERLLVKRSFHIQRKQGKSPLHSAHCLPQSKLCTCSRCMSAVLVFLKICLYISILSRQSRILSVFLYTHTRMYKKSCTTWVFFVMHFVPFTVSQKCHNAEAMSRGSGRQTARVLNQALPLTRSVTLGKLLNLWASIL